MLLKLIILVDICMCMSLCVCVCKVKSQSIIKLYMFYNMLEVGDKLLSSFGQDTLDSLQWTAAELRVRKRHYLTPTPHMLLASVYVCIL